MRRLVIMIRLFCADINLTNKGIKTETITSVKEPMTFTVDLSMAKFKDTSKLTGVKYVTNAKGEIELQLLGGQYHEKTKSFSFITNKACNYSVLEVDKLMQVNLWIDDMITKVNGKEINKPLEGFEGSAILTGGRILVPIRYVADKLGANVIWSPNEKRVLIVK